MKSVNSGPRPLAPHRAAQATAPEPEMLAAQILTFLAGDDERLNRFFALTGLDQASLRAAAANGSLTGAVLSYLGSDEDLLIGFAREAAMDPETVGRTIRAVSEQWSPED